MSQLTFIDWQWPHYAAAVLTIIPTYWFFFWRGEK